MIGRSNNCSSSNNYCATNLSCSFLFHNNQVLIPIISAIKAIILFPTIQFMLFCKPSRKAGILYEQAIGNGQTLAFRSLHPKQELPIIQHWLPSYAWNEFWHFPKPQEHPSDIYHAVQKNPNMHAIVGLLDEQLICQIDLFLAETSDLGKYIRVTATDCVARFIFSNPPIIQQAGISAFLSWYFGFSQAGHLYAIPGIQHHDSRQVLESAGFIFHHNCMLTHQAVSIYRLTDNLFANYFKK